MKKIYVFIICLLLTLDSIGQTWVQKASLPSGGGLDAPIAFSLNNKLYVGGGYSSSASNSFYQYDPATDSWTSKASIPGAIYSAATFTLNGKGYIVCGATPSLTNTVYAYDPTTDSWQIKNTFPGSARQNAPGFSFQGKGYMCGGFGGSGTEMWQYTDATDSWNQMASIPGPSRDGPACVVIGNEIFVGMGANSGGTVAYSDFYKYDPDLNSYTQMASIPEGREGPACFALGSFGYVGIGQTPSGQVSDFYQYNPSSNTWTQMNNFGRGGSVNSFCTVVNGQPYIGCGISIGGTYINDNWTSGSFPTGISTINANTTLSCYPSPSSGRFTIDMSGLHAGDKQIKIYDQLGQIVYQTTSSQNMLEINGILSTGLYTVSVTQGGIQKYGRVVIE